MYTNTNFFGLLFLLLLPLLLFLSRIRNGCRQQPKKEFMNQVNVPRLKRVSLLGYQHWKYFCHEYGKVLSFTHSTSSRICRQYDVMLLLLFSRVHYSLNNSYSKLHATAVCVCFSLSNSGFPSHSFLSLSPLTHSLHIFVIHFVVRIGRGSHAFVL